MVVKTYRGLLADGGQDRIRLSTIKGKVGYRITKFQLFPSTPGQNTVENTILIWKSNQATVSTSAVTVDFTDSDLLAAGTFHESHADNLISPAVVIFDNEIFNQDIYLTHTDTGGAVACNYYFELEVIPLDDGGAAYTTLKDMRGTGT